MIFKHLLMSGLVALLAFPLLPESASALPPVNCIYKRAAFVQADANFEDAARTDKQVTDEYFKTFDDEKLADKDFENGLTWFLAWKEEPAATLYLIAAIDNVSKGINRLNSLEATRNGLRPLMSQAFRDMQEKAAIRRQALLEWQACLNQ